MAIASLVNLVASAMVCSGSSCDGLAGYAIAASALSLIVALIVVYAGAKISGKSGRWLGLAMMLWWTAAATVQTFGGPFVVLSNGYFSAFAALLSSYFMYEAFADVDEAGGAGAGAEAAAEAADDAAV